MREALSDRRRLRRWLATGSNHRTDTLDRSTLRITEQMRVPAGRDHGGMTQQGTDQRQR
jgi:hypothetical protein